MVPVHEDDPQIVIVEFSAEPSQVVQALARQRPVPEVPELDDPVDLVLAGGGEQDVLPVQVVAVGVSGDQETGGVAGEGRGHEMKVPSCLVPGMSSRLSLAHGGRQPLRWR